MDMNDMELDLAAMFDVTDAEIEKMNKMESIVLTQNLEGFASCFPDWDLHPPVSR